MRWLFLLLALVAGGVAAYLAGQGRLDVPAVVALPARVLPLAPPDPGAPPGALAWLQLALLKRDPAQCLAWLEQAGARATPLADRTAESGCGLEGAVSLAGATMGKGGAVAASCPLAAAWTLYERWVLEPAAREHLGAGIRSVQHYGTYACRNVRRMAGPSGRRSEHATANAIDLAGVVLTDGRRLTVKRHWTGGGPEAAFWRAAADGACRLFNVTLTPEYNALHADHLHLDMGPWRACR
ncbi:MAG TPA: extensin family protein [Azospirillaceae bacterium]|nr:extensin family protein [Azospirillaceae bacterium]